MNKFVIGVSDFVVNEYRSAVLIPSMDISHLMALDEQIKKQNLKQVCIELNSKRGKDENSSKTRFEVKDKPRFKKRFAHKCPSTIPRFNKGKGSTSKPKEEKGSGTYVEKPISAKCGRKHEGIYLVCTENCYGC